MEEAECRQHEPSHSTHDEKLSPENGRCSHQHGLDEEPRRSLVRHLGISLRSVVLGNDVENRSIADLLLTPHQRNHRRFGSFLRDNGLDNLPVPVRLEGEEPRVLDPALVDRGVETRSLFLEEDVILHRSHTRIGQSDPVPRALLQVLQINPCGEEDYDLYRYSWSISTSMATSSIGFANTRVHPTPKHHSELGSLRFHSAQEHMQRAIRRITGNAYR